ncbi:MAG: tryptophan--tRNA ligase, partial [Candidatus Tectomicrobia bacterium]|nr:tryptophan--tRNA ligase [Candidatus Tectomicrobia bacterium]
PTVKMSKSFAHIRGHAVRMLDDPKEIDRTIKRAVTDSGSEIAFSDDPEKAGVNNLLGIYKVITDKSQDDVLTDFADARGYGDLKSRVAEVVINALEPIQQRYYEFMDDPAELDRMLASGAESAAAVATPKMDEIKRRVGFTLPQYQ